MTALHDWSAQDLAEAYRSRDVSPTEVTQAVLDHIASWEPRLCATWLLRPEQALEQARASAGRWQRREPLSPLDGVPATIKENIATRGDPVPLGTAAVTLQPATADAPPAARLREAGCVILGKTTMPDYGMLSSGLSSFHQLARNPWDLGRTPGGSSAGAGAAAAAGYGPLHIGTDIGGSIRLPAGWCGVFGLKPSLGRVPIDPPYTGRAAGPMTRSVADAALMMQVLAQPDARDSMGLPAQPIDWRAYARGTGRLRGLRLGLLLDAGCGLPVEPEVRAAIEHAARLFEQAGAIVQPMAPFMTPAMLDGMDRGWRMRSHVDLQALPPEKKALVLPYIQAWADSAASMGGVDTYRAMAQFHATRLATVAACSAFDYVLSPTAPMPAPPADWASPTNDPMRALEHIGFTVPFNMSEQPAASINCGHTADGLPIGLQIAGQRFDDLGVLQIAYAYEQLRGPAARLAHALTMAVDSLGNAVTLHDAASLARLDDFAQGLLRYEPRAVRLLEIADTEHSAIVQASAAALQMFAETPGAPVKARPYIERAQAAASQATPRERRFVAAIAAWVTRDIDRAIALHTEQAAEFPRDLVSLKLGQYHLFNRGDAPGMLRLARQALPAAVDVAQLHGMLAFGWEQCHYLREAEAAARQAMAQEPGEPWAHHALAHVMLTEGRLQEGQAFMQQVSPHWAGLNSFMLTHNWWHAALFAIELAQPEPALRLYDDAVWGVLKDYSQDQINAVSLLARLELAGVDVGPRWHELAPWLAPRVADHVLPFLDLQYLYGLARAGRPEAEHLLAHLAQHAAESPDTTWRTVALPAAQGLLAHARGDHGLAVAQLALALPRLREIGGSHAQRDLFQQIYVDALVQAGQLAEAQHLLQQQARLLPESMRLSRQAGAVASALRIA